MSESLAGTALDIASHIPVPGVDALAQFVKEILNLLRESKKDGDRFKKLLGDYGGILKLINDNIFANEEHAAATQSLKSLVQELKQSAATWNGRNKLMQTLMHYEVAGALDTFEERLAAAKEQYGIFVNLNMWKIVAETSTETAHITVAQAGMSRKLDKVDAKQDAIICAMTAIKDPSFPYRPKPYSSGGHDIEYKILLENQWHLRGSRTYNDIVKEMDIRLRDEPPKRGSRDRYTTWGAFWNQGDQRKHVFLKALKAKGERDVQKLLDAAIVLKKIQHENIVKFLGMTPIIDGKKANKLHIITEYCENEDVVLFFTKNDEAGTPVLLATRERLVHDLTNGLLYLHEERIHHGDVIPEHCLIDFNLRLKLGGFSRSRFLMKDDMPADNSAGHPIVRWYAPEYDSAKVGFKADVYMWATTSYYILCGHEPYESAMSSTSKMTKAIQAGPVATIQDATESLVRAGMDAGKAGLLADLLCKSWDINPDIRPSIKVARERLVFILGERRD